MIRIRSHDVAVGNQENARARPLHIFRQLPLTSESCCYVDTKSW